MSGPSQRSRTDSENHRLAARDEYNRLYHPGVSHTAAVPSRFALEHQLEHHAEREKRVQQEERERRRKKQGQMWEEEAQYWREHPQELEEHKAERQRKENKAFDEMWASLMGDEHEAGHRKEERALAKRLDRFSQAERYGSGRRAQIYGGLPTTAARGW
ncbi:hypothetical protein JCM11641_005563 [Rhodosporidiobolus odoratus]